ncbi:MAG: transketolase C-terminal domain-containing protein [Bdellovibrionales bacterium]
MASLSQAPMICVFSHAGFQDAADGASHQALTYFAMMAAIPHVKVFCLSTKEEAKQLVGQAIEEFVEKRNAGGVPDSYVFFLGRETFVESLGADLNYKLGKAQIVMDNSSDHEKSVTILSAGPLVHHALEAGEQLAARGVGSVIVNASCINDPDVSALKVAVEKTNGRLVTVEDHQIIAGMGAMAIHALSLSGVPVQAKSLGVRSQFGQSAYTANELYEKHSMDASAIFREAEKLIDS